jgi:hypothetical protein
METLNHQNKFYQCECGCNLIFFKYQGGFDFHVMYSIGIRWWIISEDQMLCGSWRPYVEQIKKCNYGQFLELIQENKNINNVWLHLYNNYGYHLIDKVIPFETELSFDYCFE